MPNLEPLRERVQIAVAERLTKIEAGDIYWATPALVTRSLLSVDQYKAELELGPVYGVTRSSESALSFQAQPDVYQDLYRFTVEVYVRLRDTVVAATWLERVWTDHVRCLLADPSLGGLVLDLRPEVTETDDGVLEPEAWFRQGWLAELSHALDA